MALAESSDATYHALSVYSAQRGKKSSMQLVPGGKPVTASALLQGNARQRVLEAHGDAGNLYSSQAAVPGFQRKPQMTSAALLNGNRRRTRRRRH